MKKFFAVLLLVLAAACSAFAADTIKWTFYTDGCAPRSTAISPDKTVYMTCDNYLYAINPDGTSKWTRSGLAPFSDPVVGPDGSLYVVEDHVLTAIVKGKEKWSFDAVINPPIAISPDGTIYASGGNGIYSINPDGTENWFYQVPYPSSFKDPVVAADGTICAVGVMFAPNIGYTTNAQYLINPDGTGEYGYGKVAPTWFAVSNTGERYASNGWSLGKSSGNSGTAIGTLPFNADFTKTLIGDDGLAYVTDYKKVAVLHPDLTVKEVIDLPTGSYPKAVTKAGVYYSSAHSVTVGYDGTIYEGVYLTDEGAWVLLAKKSSTGGLQYSWSMEHANPQHTRSVSYTAAKFGSLEVGIHPTQLSGVACRIDDWGWHTGSIIASGVPVGEYTVTCKDVPGYVAPDPFTVIVNDNETTEAVAAYHEPSGFVRVTIIPAEAVSAGAMWMVGNSWYASGTKVGAAAGTRSVTFKAIDGWVTPSVKKAVIVDQKITEMVVTYKKAGTLLVKIAPAGAVKAGAMWALDGGTWHRSGTPVPGVAVGKHKITFKDANGWVTPAGRNVIVQDGETTAITRRYVRPE